MKMFVIDKKNIALLLFLFIKPIADIFYNAYILDYFMLIMAIVILLKQIRKRKIIFSYFDLIILLFVILYTQSLFRSGIEKGFFVYVKITSAYLLYFIGKTTSGNIDNFYKFIKWGYFSAFFITLFSILLMDRGFKMWGSAYTLSGLYYYKTDLALALNGLLIFLLIQEKNRIIDFLLCGIAIFMIVFTNARISYLATAINLIIFHFYNREKKGKEKITINLKMFVIILVIFLFIIYGLNYLGKTQLFNNLGFISLSFEKISDLFSGSNTQGRISIWSQYISNFLNESFFSKLFGINIVSDAAEIMGNTGFSSHNLYISILYGIGIVGVILFLIETYYIIKRLNIVINRRTFYICLMLMILYYIFGISVNTNEFSEYTWIYMFNIGIIFNEYYSQSNNVLKKN